MIKNHLIISLLLVAFILSSSSETIAAVPHNTPPVRLCSLCHKITTLYQSVYNNIDLGGNYACWSTEVQKTQRITELNDQRNFCFNILTQCNRCTREDDCRGQETPRSIQYYRPRLQQLKLWSVVHNTCLQSFSENCQEIYNALIEVSCSQHLGECQNNITGLASIIDAECNDNVVACSTLRSPIASLNCSPNTDNSCRNQIYGIINSSCQPSPSQQSCTELNWPADAVRHIPNCPRQY